MQSKYFTRAVCVDGDIVGVIVARTSSMHDFDEDDRSILKIDSLKPPEATYILTLGVREPYRRQGFALKLVLELMSAMSEERFASCKAIFLHVFVENQQALKFYDKVGFKIHKRLYDYYIFEGGALKDAFLCVLYVNGGELPLSTWGVVMECLSDLSVNLRRCFGRPFRP